MMDLSKLVPTQEKLVGIDGDVYYKATSYNGYGSDITSLVSVENENQVDDETLNDDTTLTISVDDKSIRGLSQAVPSLF